MNRVVFAVLLCSCLDLTLPTPPPPPGPGTVQGTVVYAVAGRSSSKPAGGARVVLVNTTIETTTDLESGRFVLEGITSTTGQVLITFDADKDGATDRQKLLDLATLKAGPGRDVALGDVTLGRNAEVSGRVLLDDVLTPTGHLGTTVFVPSAPFVTVTADDGTFVLENLPEGPTEIGFFRPGYVLETRAVDLEGGQEARLTTVALAIATTSITSSLTGTARLIDGSPAANAKVRIAANGVEHTTTADSQGRFTFTNVPTGVYQLAIEVVGSKSLRVYNVIVGEEAADMGVLTLTPGSSMRVDLDGGLRLDDLPPIARITQRNLKLAPGAVMVLDGTNSTGERPIVFHWRSDGGVTFSVNDSADAGSPSMTAPLAAQASSLTLTVTDAKGRTSVPAFEPLAVGVAPTAIIGDVLGSVTPGAVVTLDGSGSRSNDSQGIVKYAWRRESGPPVPALALATAPTVSFTVPSVATEVDLVVTLRVESTFGFASEAQTKVHITPTAAWSVTAGVMQGSPLVVTNTNTPVTLTATIVNPPQGGATYRWSPSSSCAAPDGGTRPPCRPSDFEMPDPTLQKPTFVAPVADVTHLFTVEVTAGGTTQSASVTVAFVDQHTPSCDAGVSQLALRVECDFDMTAAGTVNLPEAGPLEIDADNPRRLISHFSTPLDAGLNVSLVVSGLVDQLGKPAAQISKMTTPEYSPPDHFRSKSTSSDEPRPGWLRFTSNTFGRPANQIVGRRVVGTDRMVWSMSVEPIGCSGQICELTDTSTAGIPGVGTPVDGTTVASIGNEGFVALSSTGPISIWQLTPQANPDNWSEISPGQPFDWFFAMGSDGTHLSLIAPVKGGPGLKRYVYNSASTTWDFAESIDTTFTYAANSHAVINFGGKAPPTVIASNANRAWSRFVFTANSWASTPLGGIPDTNDLRAASLNGSSLILYTDMFGELQATEPLDTYTSAIFPGAAVDGFDVVSWGDTVLMTYAHAGDIYVSLWDVTSRTVHEIVPSGSSNHWNNDALFSASRPRLTLLGNNQVGLTWQEFDDTSGTYRMAGRYVR